MTAGRRKAPKALMFAEKNADGSWTTTVVDDTSADVGDENIDLDVLPDGSDDVLATRGSLDLRGGRPVIAYDNSETGEVLVAERSAGGTWSKNVVSAVGTAELGLERHVAMVALPDGSLLLFTVHAGGRPLVARRTGSTWSEERLDLETDLARHLGAGNVNTPNLIVADDGTAHHVFVDRSNGAIGVATRTPSGVWSLTEMIGRSEAPSGSLYLGNLYVDPYTFGSVILPDGARCELRQWRRGWRRYAEDSLVADPGGPHRLIAGARACSTARARPMAGATSSPTPGPFRPAARCRRPPSSTTVVDHRRRPRRHLHGLRLAVDLADGHRQRRVRPHGVDHDRCGPAGVRRQRRSIPRHRRRVLRPDRHQLHLEPGGHHRHGENDLLA